MYTSYLTRARSKAIVDGLELTPKDCQETCHHNFDPIKESTVVKKVKVGRHGIVFRS